MRMLIIKKYAFFLNVCSKHTETFIKNKYIQITQVFNLWRCVINENRAKLYEVQPKD